MCLCAYARVGHSVGRALLALLVAVSLVAVSLVSRRALPCYAPSSNASTRPCLSFSRMFDSSSGRESEGSKDGAVVGGARARASRRALVLVKSLLRRC